MPSPALLLAVAALVTGNGLAAATAVNAKLESGQKAVLKVCQLPVEAEWSQVSITGARPMSKEAEDWGLKLQQFIGEIMTKAGVAVVAENMTPDGLQRDESLRQTVLQLQQKYDGVAAQLHRKPGGVKKGRYTLGDEVSLLPCSAQADALIFVRAYGNILSATSRPILMVTFRWFSTATLYLTVVDSKSGEVLAYMHVEKGGDAFRNNLEYAFADTLAADFKEGRRGAAGGAKK
jgi:hypothetical protein